MDYEFIKVDRGGEVAVDTFNRPEKANALNQRHIEEIEHAAQSYRDDDLARVVIFTGAGRHFNSGADLTAKDPEHALLTVRRRRRRIGQHCIQAILDMDQITIAAWRGAAMGGGACIATAVDFRVGAKDCFMSYPEILIGVNLMWQSLPLLVHLVGPARAKQLVISGKHIQGPTLFEWGVLDEIVETDQVMDKTIELARHYSALPPVPAQMIKRSVNAIASALDRSVMHADFDQHLLASSTTDQDEAVAAYLEKRPPSFKGK